MPAQRAGPLNTVAPFVTEPVPQGGKVGGLFSTPGDEKVSDADDDDRVRLPGSSSLMS
jgi:hypothetical protein